MAKFQKKQNKNVKKSPFEIIWGKNNWILFGAGTILLALGYFLMAGGSFQDPVSLTVSPLILLVAYLVIFPLAILKKSKKQDTNDFS